MLERLEPVSRIYRYCLPDPWQNVHSRDSPPHWWHFSCMPFQSFSKTIVASSVIRFFDHHLERRLGDAFVFVFFLVDKPLKACCNVLVVDP